MLRRAREVGRGKMSIINDLLHQPRGAKPPAGTWRNAESKLGTHSGVHVEVTVTLESRSSEMGVKMSKVGGQVAKVRAP